MSADLLAEFGPGSVAAPQSSANQPRSKQPQANSLIDDFENSAYEFSNSATGPSHGWAQTSPAPQATQAIPSMSRQPPGFEFFNLPRQDNSDVLFDAADDQPAGEDEDDWGDFEGPQATQSVKPTSSATAAPKTQGASAQRANTQMTGTIDLLDSLSINEHKTKPIAKPVSKGTTQKSPIAASKAPAAPAWDDDQDDWGDFADGPSTNPPPQKAKAKPSKPPINIAPQEPAWDDEGFDDWGDFDDGPSTTAAAPKPKIPLKAKPVKGKTKSISEPKPSQGQNYFTASTTAQTPENVRPTNIPPPSVLLGLLVTSLTNLHKEATAAKQPSVSENVKTATANTINTTLSTTAHIIAGRQLRWKRDSILSQSMRIGPAQGRGMKLNTVNKHEDVKEAQDAVVVLDLWRERALLFSTVVQGAGLRPVPTVADPAALKVITARSEQGAIKASHACALCALRRDERVLKIDEGDVNDSFGEWWTEHWGHTACRAFWEANKKLLGQR